MSRLALPLKPTNVVFFFIFTSRFVFFLVCSDYNRPALSHTFNIEFKKKRRKTEKNTKQIVYTLQAEDNVARLATDKKYGYKTDVNSTPAKNFRFARLLSMRWRQFPALLSFIRNSMHGSDFYPQKKRNKTKKTFFA